MTIKGVKKVPIEVVRKRATRARGTVEERRSAVHAATTGLNAGVKVTKDMYRPGSSK